MAIGFATLAAAGVIQMNGTSAAFTDSAVATSSFTASSAFYPTPLVRNISCGTSYNAGLAKTVANISWDAPTPAPLAGQTYTYRVTIVQDSNNSNVVHNATQTGRSYTFVNNGTVKGKGWYVRVFTINGPSTSSGWQSQGVSMAGGGYTASCTGNNDGQPNANGLNRSAPTAEAADLDAGKAGTTTEATTTTSTSTTTTPSGRAATTSPTTTASTTSTGAATATTPNSTATTTESSTSSTTTTTSSTPTGSPVGETVSLPGGRTAQLLDDDGRMLSIGKAGDEVCRVAVLPTESLVLEDGALLLRGGGTDRAIDPATCDIT